MSSVGGFSSLLLLLPELCSRLEGCQGVCEAGTAVKAFPDPPNASTVIRAACRVRHRLRPLCNWMRDGRDAVYMSLMVMLSLGHPLLVHTRCECRG